MPNIILVGETNRCNEHIASYMTAHSIADYEREDLSEAIRIADARKIKRSLSFMNSGQKMFVFSGEFTVEAQNALLKVIEEHSENIHFFFCSQNVQAFLPTIQSRCSIVRLENIYSENESLAQLIKQAISFGGKSSWDSLEKLSETVTSEGMDILIQGLRDLLLSNIENREELSRHHMICKALLKAVPLHKNNNINVRVLLENTFGVGSTFVKTTS